MDKHLFIDGKHYRVEYSGKEYTKKGFCTLNLWASDLKNTKGKELAKHKIFIKLLPYQVHNYCKNLIKSSK